MVSLPTISGALWTRSRDSEPRSVSRTRGKRRFYAVVMTKFYFVAAVR
jgi:hypothetical protein